MCNVKYMCLRCCCQLAIFHLIGLWYNFIFVHCPSSITEEVYRFWELLTLLEWVVKKVLKGSFLTVTYTCSQCHVKTCPSPSWTWTACLLIIVFCLLLFSSQILLMPNFRKYSEPCHHGRKNLSLCPSQVSLFNHTWDMGKSQERDALEGWRSGAQTE